MHHESWVFQQTECSAIGSAPGLGPGGCWIVPSHSDHFVMSDFVCPKCGGHAFTRHTSGSVTRLLCIFDLTVVAVATLRDDTVGPWHRVAPQRGCKGCGDAAVAE